MPVLSTSKGRSAANTSARRWTRPRGKRLLPWCEGKGFRHLKQLDVDALRQFRTTWPDGPLSAYKNLERLRGFLGLCLQSSWIEKNHAKALKPPKLPDTSTKVKVFTEAQLAKILRACNGYPQWNAYGHDNRARVRALVLTLRWSGMRIGDCVGLQRVHLNGDKLSLNTHKSGSKIFVPLPKEAVNALESLGGDGGSRAILGRFTGIA